MLQMGGITGDCWLMCEWMPEVQDRYCKVSVLDSDNVCGIDNGDYNKVKSFLVRQPLQSGPDQPYNYMLLK